MAVGAATAAASLRVGQLTRRVPAVAGERGLGRWAAGHVSPMPTRDESNRGARAAFGGERLRPELLAATQHLAAGRDVLVVLPPGAGETGARTLDLGAVREHDLLQAADGPGDEVA